jgi:acyl carrier protein
MIDSFSFIELIAFIESKFQVVLNDKNLADPKFCTIDGLIDIIFFHLHDG